MRRVLTLLILLAVPVSPAVGLLQAEQSDVVGRWLLIGFEVDGEPVEDDDVGDRVLVFTADGEMEAWSEGRLDDRGWYEIDEEGLIRVIEDYDEDGEIDASERDDAEPFEWSRDGDRLLFTSVLDEGEGVTLTIQLELTEE